MVYLLIMSFLKKMILKVLRLADNVLRRQLDFLVALIGLILLSPLYLIITILIRSDSPGPIVYKGRRMGRFGREFEILKFRTMYESDHSYAGPKITGKGDERITPVGSWLRKTKINEFPQLINVLKGDMSLVGPRPEDPEVVDEWPSDVKEKLLAVRPGITSPASVVYHDEESILDGKNVMDAYLQIVLPDKLRMDKQYLSGRNILSDLDVMFWTLFVIIPKINEIPVPEHKLYWGPIARFFTRYFNWYLIDVPVAFIAITITGLIFRIQEPLHIGKFVAPFVAFSMSILFSLVNVFLGLDRIYWSKARAEDALGLGISCIITTFGIYLADKLIFMDLFVPTDMLLFSGFLSMLGFVFVRYRSRIFTGLASLWLRLRGGGWSWGKGSWLLAPENLGVMQIGY